MKPLTVMLPLDTYAHLQNLAQREYKTAESFAAELLVLADREISKVLAGSAQQACRDYQRNPLRYR